MRKGAGDIVYLFGSVIVVLLFLTVFLAILQRLPGNEQAAKLNTELLRSKIHEACLKGSAELTGLSLMQPIPQAVAFTPILPAGRINTKGDPDFLLYYEAFPIGEGLGWEVYQPLGDRVFAPFYFSNSDNVGDTINIVDFEEKLFKNSDSHYNKMTEEALKRKPELKERKLTVFVPNVMLSDYVNIMPTSEPEPVIDFGRTAHKGGDAGEWLKKTPYADAKTENIYKIELKFGSDKSYIKYRPCGVNSLCLKTAEYVHRVPLNDVCKDLQYIYLTYDKDSGQTAKQVGLLVGVGVAAGGLVYLGVAHGIRAVWVTIKKIIDYTSIMLTVRRGLLLAGVGAGTLKLVQYIGGAFIGLFFSKKSSDFYLASPCKFTSKMVIKEVACSQLSCGTSNDRWIKYPVYNVFVGDNNVKQVRVEGIHYQCINGIGPSDLIARDSLQYSDAPQGRCINVIITQEIPQYFCWTKNPFGEGRVDIDLSAEGDNIKDIDLLQGAKNSWASFFKFNTVIDNTEYFGNNVIHVKPVPDPLGISALKELANIDWKWPG